MSVKIQSHLQGCRIYSFKAGLWLASLFPQHFHYQMNPSLLVFQSHCLSENTSFLDLKSYIQDHICSSQFWKAETKSFMCIGIFLVYFYALSALTDFNHRAGNIKQIYIERELCGILQIHHVYSQTMLLYWILAAESVLDLVSSLLDIPHTSSETELLQFSVSD